MTLEKSWQWTNAYMATWYAKSFHVVRSQVNTQKTLLSVQWFSFFIKLLNHTSSSECIVHEVFWKTHPVSSKNKHQPPNGTHAVWIMNIGNVYILVAQWVALFSHNKKAWFESWLILVSSMNLCVNLVMDWIPVTIHGTSSLESGYIPHSSNKASSQTSRQTSGRLVSHTFMLKSCSCFPVLCAMFVVHCSFACWLVSIVSRSVLLAH